MITHPFGDHAQSCITLVFRSKCFCSVPLPLHETSLITPLLTPSTFSKLVFTSTSSSRNRKGKTRKEKETAKIHIRSCSQLFNKHPVRVSFTETSLKLCAKGVFYQQVHGLHIALLHSKLQGRFLYQCAALVT